MEDLKIIYLRPEELTPYEKNVKRHEKLDLDAIKASIKDGVNVICQRT